MKRRSTFYPKYCLATVICFAASIVGLLFQLGGSVRQRLGMLLLLFAFLLALNVSAQDTEHADDAPLAFPPLEHYAKLWENSMFTTKSLPPPDDAPKGPIFTDNLTLSGTYEVDGALAAVLMDRTTSQFMEVRIGAENEQGVKIVRVNPGSTPDKTRLQLQKGDEAGWVSFAAEAASPPDQSGQGPPGPGGAQSGSAIPGRPMIPQPTSQPAIQPNIPSLQRGIPSGPPAMRSQPAAPSPPPPQPIPQSPVTPVVPASVGAASGDGDIPLPPQ